MTIEEFTQGLIDASDPDKSGPGLVRYANYPIFDNAEFEQLPNGSIMLRAKRKIRPDEVLNFFIFNLIVF